MGKVSFIHERYGSRLVLGSSLEQQRGEKGIIGVGVGVESVDLNTSYISLLSDAGSGNHVAQQPPRQTGVVPHASSRTMILAKLVLADVH